MYGNDLRCNVCNQYFPDRCTCDEWQSNVQWPEECYQGMYGDGVSTDKHRTKEGAQAVCAALECEGFGCDGEHFPIQTWVTKVGAEDPILEGIRAKRDRILKLKELWMDVNELEKLCAGVDNAKKETEKLQEDRIVPENVLKERFDI